MSDLGFDIEKCSVAKFDKARFAETLRKFEFYSLLKRLPGAESRDATRGVPDTDKSKAAELKITIVDGKNMKEFETAMKSADEFACRETTDRIGVTDGKPNGMVFAAAGRFFYMEDADIAFLRELFGNKNKTLVGHDLKRLVKALKSRSVEVLNRLFDVMIASYIINSSTRAHDIRSIAMRELNKDLPAGSDQGSLFGVGFKGVASELALVLEAKQKYDGQLEKMEDKGLFDKMEMKLIPVLAEMELNGIAIDAAAFKELSADINKEINTLVKKICEAAKFDFNPASSVQLREVLFEKLHLPTQGVRKGKTGYSTADSELEKLAGLHPIIGLMREYREVAKLQNTYVDVLPTLVNKKTGRIHTSFNQAVTATGRLSSSDPNLQNIPIRTDLGREIRDSFIAERGNVLVCADYSQIELRIVASLAQDRKMIGIFEKGEDIHKATAAVIHGVPLDKVTKEMRHSAKEVNFGVLYGMGPYGLSWRAGITRVEAQDFITKYFQEFSGVKKYIDQTLEFAKKEGYVETLFGRRRHIPELKSDNFMLRSAGERMAINMPIQGTAADLMKMAMIEVHKVIKSLKFIKSESDVRLILQVHDELVLEVKKGLEDKVLKTVKEAMENVVKLRVPIEVSVGAGKRWGEIK